MDTAIAIAVPFAAGAITFITVMGLVTLWRSVSERLAVFKLKRTIRRKAADLGSGNLASPMVISGADHNYTPVGEEKLLRVHELVCRIRWKPAGNQANGSASSSGSDATGIMARFRGRKVSGGRQATEAETGRLLVTNEALVFEGRSGKERWTWGELAEVEISRHGYAIHLVDGMPIRLDWKKSDPETCAVIGLMLRRAT